VSSAASPSQSASGWSDSMCRASARASSSSFAAFNVSPHSLQSITRMSGLLSPPARRLTALTGDTPDVPFTERDDGVSIFWQEWGEGPGVLVVHSYIQHPKVLEGLLDELREGHRTIRYDPRGAGESSRQGPYGMEEDIGDLIA